MLFRHFVYPNGDVDVSCYIDGTWQPWVLVRESAALLRLRQRGKGLYAARCFPRGSLIGWYVGKILGRASDPTVLRLVEQLSITEEGNAILDLNGIQVDGRQSVQPNEEQRELCGTVLFDQSRQSWPGAYAHIANDARGTSLATNCKVDELGNMRTTRQVEAYDQSKITLANVASELLWDYGDAYWLSALS